MVKTRPTCMAFTVTSLLSNKLLEISCTHAHSIGQAVQVHDHGNDQLDLFASISEKLIIKSLGREL